jgi:fumarate hydratase subunit alpha
MDSTERGKNMREIDVSRITDAVRRMCISANINLPQDMKDALLRARKQEDGPIAQTILDRIMENYALAQSGTLPICQDTGMACIFLETGQDVHFTGGSLYDAVNEGVRLGYTEGYMRKSVERDPIRRGNTGDNTPALITVDIVPGDKVKLTVAPKGFGSENMSALKMLKPSAGLEGIKAFILETVEHAGPNPCPPIVVGVGIGGNFDHVALLAKKALLRPVDSCNPDPFYAALEEELLEEINALGIGPQGFGGRTTALGVNIEYLPTHIAGMPCAVNISCHVTRHETEVI